MAFAAFLGILAMIIVASATDFTDCGSSSKVTKVEVDGCPDGGGTCVLKKGTNVKFTVEFEAQSAVSSIGSWASEIMHNRDDYEHPLDLETKKSPCDQLGCPLEVGKVYTYTNTLDVSSALESDDADLDLEINSWDSYPTTKVFCVFVKSQFTK